MGEGVGQGRGESWGEMGTTVIEQKLKNKKKKIEILILRSLS